MMNLKKFLLLCTFIFSALCFGEHSVENAGFSHCGLVYHTDKITANSEYFKPMLVKYMNSTPTNQSGFDGYLFLYYELPNGRRTEIDATNKSDWEFILDAYFKRDVDVSALNQAVGELRQTGFLSTDKTIQVMFAVPWLNPNMTDFGDVDGDGVSENLAIPADRQKVILWYMFEVIKLMQQNPNLNLWGFYMMRESMADTGLEVAQDITSNAHNLGLKVMWIPYYGAANRSDWKNTGFDVAFLQSNWIFRGQDVRRNRMLNTQLEAESLDMGVELELSSYRPTPRARRIFYESLETAYNCGFKLPIAYYFGAEFLYLNDAPECRQLYEVWMDFMAGKPVEIPQIGNWSQQIEEDNSMIIDYTLEESAIPVALDLITKNIRGEFSGAVSVEGRISENEEFKPLAWQIYIAQPESKHPYNNITILLPEIEVKQLRVKLTLDKKELLEVVDVLCQLDPPKGMTLRSKNYKMPYFTDQLRPMSKYPDHTARDLIDGIIGQGSWSEYVGWLGSEPLTMWFTLGEELEFDKIRFQILNDSKHAIIPPNQITAVVSKNQPIMKNFGFGEQLGLEEVVTISSFKVSANGQSLTARFSKPVSGDYITFFIKKSGWFFLSEIELFNKTKKVATNRGRISYLPLASVEDTTGWRYLDDFSILCDGLVSSSHNSGSVGFNGKKTHHILVDLGQINHPVNYVDCYIVDGNLFSIGTPKSIKVSTSNDMVNWSESASITPESRSLEKLESRKLTIQTPNFSGRYVMIAIESTSPWSFVSEIAVY